MNGTSLAMKIGSVVIGLGIFAILAQKLEEFKKYAIISLIYAVVCSILLAVPTLLLLMNGGMSESFQIIITQGVIVLLGIIHVFLSNKILPWYRQLGFGVHIVFSLFILLFGFFFMNLSLSFLVISSVPIVWYLSLLWFLIPILLNQTIIVLAKLPDKEFTHWYYPVNESIEDPSDEELDNPIVISFVFYKNSITKELTTFRAKAPAGMQLGRLFYFFINDYNGRHADDPISFTDDQNQPDPWVFFKLKSKLLRTKEALNFHETILNNHIKENAVLICRRNIKPQEDIQHETDK